MNTPDYFVPESSIVRKIWGTGDAVLFIFAGAAAEFSLNKAVDWLYFTGKLPADPLKRLFSTVSYASNIVFAPTNKALQTIDAITAIHGGVEKARGQHIPDWAYRDVLYMLMDYSIRSYELVERPLTPAEKEEVYDVFLRMGHRMQIPALPPTHANWMTKREEAMQQNMLNGPFTKDLFRQYRKHLGGFRYYLLRLVQSVLVPKTVADLLHLKPHPFAKPLLAFYRFTKYIGIGNFLKRAILPAAYKEQVMQLDRITQTRTRQ
jgi:uncharacterized protein (DUF2236 family)